VLLAVERQFAAALLAASLGEADFHVHWTANPERAARLARDGDIDAVLVDLSTESAAAIDAVEELCQRLAGTPVVAIVPDSAFPLPAAVRFVVRKPFTGDELVATVRAAIESRATAVVPLRGRAAPSARGAHGRQSDPKVER
jgi:DNA-binding response OmpR family regulator